MFDIGFSELLVIAVVALIVLGPERLPKAARFAGLWVRRARQQWYSVKSEFESELAADELKRSLRETQESLRAAQAQLRDGATALQQQVAALEAEAVEPAPALEQPAGTQQDQTQQTQAQDREATESEEPDAGLESARMLDALEPPPPSDEDEDDTAHDTSAGAARDHDMPVDDTHAKR